MVVQSIIAVEKRCSKKALNGVGGAVQFVHCLCTGQAL